MVYIAAGMLSGNWILPLYSIVAYYVGLNAVDFIVEGIDRSKGVMIITDKADEVCAALMDAFACGTTKIAAKGGFPMLTRLWFFSWSTVSRSPG